jgi:opacity protein-like surface antigen
MIERATNPRLRIATQHCTNMSSTPPGLSRRNRAPLAWAFACLGACIFGAPSLRAEPTKLPPEVGYNYNEVETGRSAGKNGGDRALSNSVSALFQNPAGMATARVYHASALVQLWPEASRQSYGVGAVDSIGSSSKIAGGLGATWSRQDPGGINRTSSDLRFALAYPLSDKLFVGAGGRFMWLSQDGRGPLGTSYASSGLQGEKIFKSFAFDLGLTLRPGGGLSLALVGNNLNGTDTGYQPLTLGGGIGFAKDKFGIEADVVADLVTWDKTRLRVMGGPELMLGEHVVLRGGYRFDDGAKSHSASLGLGYIDKSFSADAGVRRVFVGDIVTAVVLTLTFHVESTGLTPTPSETW